MRALLLQAEAQLLEALRLTQAALTAPTPERAGNLTHDADLTALAAANTLSRAFGAAAEVTSRPPGRSSAPASARSALPPAAASDSR